MDVQGKKRPLDGLMSATAAPPMLKKARFELPDSVNDESTPSTAMTPTSPTTTTSNDHESYAATSVTSTSSKKRPKVYICDFENCDKAFDRPVRLEAHKRTHTNDRPFVCQEPGCTKSFFKSEHLKAHLQNNHSNEASYICTYVISTNDEGEDFECGRAFTTSTRLKRHAATHEKAEELKCQAVGCGQVFRKMETLQRHIKKDHLGEKAYRCDKLVYDELSGPEEECGEEFASVGQLKSHENREHNRMKHFCSICSPPDDPTILPVAFATYHEYQAHLKTVHPPTCTICQQACPSNRALAAHMEIEHSTLASRKEKFKCTWPGCDRGFTRKGNLNVHIQSTHVKQRKFVCGQFDLSTSDKCPGWENEAGCGMACTSKATLESHVRTQHLGLQSTNPSRKRSRQMKKELKASSLMDLDDPTDQDTTEPGATALALLTGHNYADTRPIACWSSSCPMRFKLNYALAQHMELSHGWNVDDINDRLAEEEALSGGQFWIGGMDENAGAMGQEEEELLRTSLSQALRLQPENELAGVSQTGSTRLAEDVDTPVWSEEDSDEMAAIDPMLAMM